MAGKENVELNRRRRRVAVTLKTELGMTNKQIGSYLGLHPTSVNHLIKRGSTSSKTPARLMPKHTQSRFSF